MKTTRFFYSLRAKLKRFPDSTTKRVCSAGKAVALIVITVWLVIANSGTYAIAADNTIRITKRNVTALYDTTQGKYICYASGRPLRSLLGELRLRSVFVIGGRFSLVNPTHRRNSLASEIRKISRTLAHRGISPSKRAQFTTQLLSKQNALLQLNVARQLCRQFNPLLCSNHLQDSLELGVDCGGQCHTQCPPIANPIQNPSSSSSQASELPNGGSAGIISSNSSSASASSVPVTACNDGIDNDQDNKIDLADAGCGSEQDNSEQSHCDHYQILDSVEGVDSEGIDLSQHGITPNRAIFLYEGDYGHFPRRFCYQGSCTDFYGVIPQVGVENLESHLTALRQYVERAVPDPNFSGWIVSDIEAYSPFSWNRTAFPRLDSIYKTLSRQRVIDRDPTLPLEQVEVLAEAEFNQSALQLLVESLRAIRALRPLAKLSLYGYPLALPNDYSWGYTSPIYGDYNRDYNNRLGPIWNELDGFTPVIYQHIPLGWRFDSGDTESYLYSTYWIEAVMVESARLQRQFGFKEIVPIVWHRYFDGGTGPYRNQLMSVADLQIQLFYPLSLGANSVILWGNEISPWGSEFSSYVQNVMGPQIATFCANDL